MTNCAGLATLAWAGEAVEPGSRVSCFGHFGDGNIHFSVSQPTSADKSAFLARWDAINDVVHAIAARMGGSFSAEHGGEQLKLRRRKTRARSRSRASSTRALRACPPQAIGQLRPAWSG